MFPPLPMNAQLDLSSTGLTATNLQQVVEQIFETRRITRVVQRALMATVLSKTLLSYEEKALVDRVFEALRRGILRVVD